MDIIRSIQESAQGWRMGIASLIGGVSAKFSGVSAPMQSTSEIGTALIGSGFAAAQQRFAGIKAGGVSVVSAQTAQRSPFPLSPLPLRGERYMTSSRILTSPPIEEGARVGIRNTENETPATLIEKIQKSIGESAEGWRMGYAHVAGKAKAGIEKSVAGWQMGISEAGSKVSESFANVGDWFKSTKWQMLLPVIILAFIAVMVAIGYSGVGGPAARVAEREYVKRR